MNVVVNLPYDGFRGENLRKTVPKLWFIINPSSFSMHIIKNAICLGVGLFFSHTHMCAKFGRFQFWDVARYISPGGHP